ncbi:MAG: hypothetical protein AAB367_01140 [Patescibacteria group bacterium]
MYDTDMQEFAFVVALIDFFGFVASLFAIFIIAESSSVLVPKLRKGILRLMWGVGCIAFSFFWNVLNDVTPGVVSVSITDTLIFPADRALVVLGVILMLLAAYNLFRVRSATA